MRKSFAKHFIDGLKWIEHAPSDYIETVPRSIKVDSAEAQDWTKAYEYAMEMTKRELKQADLSVQPEKLQVAPSREHEK